MITTRLTQLFELRYPLLNAPMGRYSNAELALAVSNGGGLGTFGAIHPSRPIEQAYVEEQILNMRQNTDRPFGVGFITHLIDRHESVFDCVLEHEVPVVTLSFSDPRPWLGKIKASGATAICQVQTPDDATIAIGEGADILAVQGNEAAGHCGELNLLPFLSATLDKYPDTPIIAAGGMASARSLAAVLAAGADGAWIGTGFAATPEASGVPPIMKKRILASDGRDTLRNRVFDIVSSHVNALPDWRNDIAFRCRCNDLINKWHGKEDVLRNRVVDVAREYAEARQAGNTDIIPDVFGESAGFISSRQGAADFMRSLCEQAENHLQISSTLLS
jgi:nitronate monooxygenase